MTLHVSDIANKRLFWPFYNHIAKQVGMFFHPVTTVRRFRVTPLRLYQQAFVSQVLKQPIPPELDVPLSQLGLEQMVQFTGTQSWQITPNLTDPIFYRSQFCLALLFSPFSLVNCLTANTKKRAGSVKAYFPLSL